MVPEEDWKLLSKAAWSVRKNSFLIGITSVGAAILVEGGRIYVGCNVEHKFRSHDIHAEVNAISSMVAGGDHKMTAILIVAERELFTPCGGCMDWIMQLGGPEVEIGVQSNSEENIKKWTAQELMPFYPG